MKLTVDFPALETLRGRMGAPLSGWRLGDTTLDPRAKLLIDLVGGIEIDLQDVEAGPGKLLTYRGEQVILYIKDTRSSQWTLENEPEKSRRFHIAECRTLDRMREEALKVCKNCLSSLNWRGYEKPADRLQFGGGKQQSRTQIWERFAIDEFLREYSTFFRSKPSRKDLSAKLNIYVEDWPHISEQRRWQAKWRCETCSVGLSAHPNLLHCHHKNGVVTDNDPSNLMVLCALCHAEQPGHNHMKVPASQRAIILAARGR